MGSISKQGARKHESSSSSSSSFSSFQRINGSSNCSKSGFLFQWVESSADASSGSKVSAQKKDLVEGTRLHLEVQKRGLLDKNCHLASSVINMYAKCGALAKAQEVFDGLAHQNVVCWNTLIAGYVRHRLLHEALHYFEKMQRKGIFPTSVTFICILKACGNMGAIDKGKEIHDMIIDRGFLEKDDMLGTALVDMYAKCGMFEKARQILEELSAPDVVGWSALIAGYAQQGQCHEALNCLESMQREGIHPNEITFICILKACGNAGAIEEGKKIHEHIVRRSLLAKDTALGNALVDMYVKCGVLTKAKEVFENLHARNVVSWSTLIVGYAQQGRCKEAMECFDRMQSEGLSPDSVTFICILKACGATMDIDKGKKIHQHIINKGFLETDTILGSALVDMYSKCGALSRAREVLEKLPVRNVVSWSALITGYALKEQVDKALDCLDRMQSEGIAPNAVTFICILKACANTGSVEKGKQIHENILRKGFLQCVALGNALVDMYARCGMLAEAQQVLEDLPARDIVSWNVLISGYLQWGQDQEALNCFEQVESEGLSPDVVTFIGVLKACGSTGAIDKGKQIHKLIIDRSLLQRDILLGTALVDMYAKCGMLVNAKEVLEDLPTRNAVAWSALIAGYSQQQQVHDALIGLEQMQNEGFSPNDITVLSLLSACSHVGLLDVARSLFRNMTTNYGITPNLEHHTCMVMTFGCVGHFDEAVSVVKAMPSDYCAVWLALLGVCKKWGNVKLGALAFDQVIQLDYTCAAAYVFMANIFSAAGMKEDEEKIKSMRLQFSTPSKLGNSDWVDGMGNIHLFSTGDKSHVQSKDICGELKPNANEMFEQGFSQTTHFMSRNLIG